MNSSSTGIGLLKKHSEITKNFWYR